MAIDPADVIFWPEVVFREPVGSCVIFHREEAPGVALTIRGREAEFRTLRLLGPFPLCPGVEAPAASPAAIARRVVEEFVPAAPAPSIAPGYAITGKQAYLETNGNLAPAAQTRATELGDIEMRFRGRYVVDWGDGSPLETHDIEGEPWPAGRIVHTYTHTGRYDVVVTVQWSAQWRFGTASGEITTGLDRTARIDDFEVRQLQAVRNT